MKTITQLQAPERGGLQDAEKAGFAKVAIRFRRNATKLLGARRSGLHDGRQFARVSEELRLGIRFAGGGVRRIEALG
jgi:hypothetical protein